MHSTLFGAQANRVRFRRIAKHDYVIPRALETIGLRTKANVRYITIFYIA